MNLKCLLGIHEWSSCKCSKCGKTRDESHDWAADCEKCAKCSKTRSGEHIWSGCKCSKCAKTRNEGHDWGDRLGPCKSCGASNPERLLVDLIGNPNQDDWGKNENTAKQLKPLLSGDILAAVIELLASDSCRVRSHAAHALGVLGDKRAVIPLTDFIRKPYEDESISYYSFPGGGRSTAIGALKTLAGIEAVPALIAALEDKSWSVREEAAHALCELGDARAAEALERIYLPVRHLEGGSGEPRARMWAKRALQKMIGDEVLLWCKSRNETHVSDSSCKCSACGTTSHSWKHGKCSHCGLVRRHYCNSTDLHLAICSNADLNEIRLLSRNGLVNMGDEEGFTPLMKASGKEGNLAIVKILIEESADVNVKSMRGTTALSMAALHGKNDVEEYLSSRGAVRDFVVRQW